MIDKPRFEVIFILERGGEVGPFPVTEESARRAVEVAAGTSEDAPFLPTIMAEIDREPGLLRWALQRLYAHIVKRGAGTFYMDDGISTYWGVMANRVMAFSIEDTELRPPTVQAPRRYIGFAPYADPDSTEGS